MNTPEPGCYLCGGRSHRNRPGRVRDREDLLVKECENCGLVFLDPHGLEMEPAEMYGEASNTDPELIRREYYSDDKRRVNFLGERLANRRLLDFGSGAGGFLKLARNLTEQVHGIELETEMHQSYREMGITVSADLEEFNTSGDSFDIITAFHVVEHLADPAEVLRHLATLLSEDGELIIEVPSSEDVLLTLFECKPFQSFTYWSQHRFLFNNYTLKMLAGKAGLEVRWLQQVQRYSLANHLHWLSKGLPGGHKHWHWLSDSALDQAYENRLANFGPE
jgi:SAM-dependent methyltransferase